MKKNKNKSLLNQTITQLHDEYAQQFLDLQDSYEAMADGDLSGGEVDWHDFWACNGVRKIGCLLELFYDIKKIRESEGQL